MDPVSNLGMVPKFDHVTRNGTYRFGDAIACGGKICGKHDFDMAVSRLFIVYKFIRAPSCDRVITEALWPLGPRKTGAQWPLGSLKTGALWPLGPLKTGALWSLGPLKTGALWPLGPLKTGAIWPLGPTI